jgi:hypothetical protein
MVLRTLEEPLMLFLDMKVDMTVKRVDTGGVTIRPLVHTPYLNQLLDYDFRA